MDQETAISILLSPRNVFLTGAPGSGKSFVLGNIIYGYQKLKTTVAITASTGIAASQIGGVTLHSWMGAKNNSDLSQGAIENLSNNPMYNYRFRHVEVIIIDEISMLQPELFESLNNLLQYVRSSSKPFGGVKLIVVGDFFQLPPVSKLGPKDIKYVFNSLAWKEAGFMVCYLNTQYRQDSRDELKDILDKIRLNAVGDKEISLLQKRISISYLDNVIGLYPYNYDVELKNKLEFDRLRGKIKKFGFYSAGNNSGCLTILKNLRLGEIYLKKGTEVIFIVNNPKQGYLNGSRGRVVDFKNKLPLVQLDNGNYLVVQYYNFKMEINNKVTAEVWALPLRLAYAITIHKSQGMSLDRACVDLERVFGYGMGYVGLSRLRSLEGLYLTGVNKKALKVDPKVIRMDRVWHNASSKIERLIKQSSIASILLL